MNAKGQAVQPSPAATNHAILEGRLERNKGLQFWPPKLNEETGEQELDSCVMFEVVFFTKGPQAHFVSCKAYGQVAEALKAEGLRPEEPIRVMGYLSTSLTNNRKGYGQRRWTNIIVTDYVLLERNYRKNPNPNANKPAFDDEAGPAEPDFV